MASSSQQFSLRWNNHTNNMLQVFLEQYTSEWLVDVTLSCQGKFLKAHKMVVAACSPYFKELFNLHDTPHPIIILNGIQYSDMKAIVEFMYRGEIKVQESELDNLLDLAETLQIMGLCHIRKKYVTSGVEEPVELQSEVSEEMIEDSYTNTPEVDPLNISAVNQSVPVRRSRRSAVVRVRVNDQNANEEDELSSMIKVEPPDIRDIDEDDAQEDWTTPRLIIDLPELSSPANEKPINTKSVTSPPKETNLLTGKRNSLHDPTVLQQEDLSSASSLESKIPRPPNAFMVFANEWRRKLAFEHPSENNKEISVRLGLMWKSLAPEAKEGYYAASRKADLEHKRKYPGYYYSPKEARLRKRLKQRNSNSNSNIEAMQLVRVLMVDEEARTSQC